MLVRLLSVVLGRGRVVEVRRGIFARAGVLPEAQAVFSAGQTRVAYLSLAAAGAGEVFLYVNGVRAAALNEAPLVIRLYEGDELSLFCTGGTAQLLLSSASFDLAEDCFPAALPLEEGRTELGVLRFK